MEDQFQFDRPGIGATLTYCAIEGLLLLLLVIAIEVCHHITCVALFTVCVYVVSGLIVQCV